MTTIDEFDRLLDDWIAAAAPKATPQKLHSEAMERTLRARQRRSWSAVPRAGVAGRQSRPGLRLAYMGLIVAAVTAVSLGALILAFGGGPTSGPTVVSSSSPSTPTVAPTSTQMPAPAESTAPLPTAQPAVLDTAGFVRPFSYSIPRGSGLQLFHGGCPQFECDFFVGPDPDKGGLDPGLDHPRESDLHGVVVVRVSPSNMVGCSVVPRIRGRRSPRDFLADLQAAEGTALGPVTSATVDGRDALGATLEPTPSCSFHLRADASPLNSSGSVSFQDPSRLIVLDVDGETVLVDIWARTADDLDAWLPTATEFMDSIRFAKPPSPSEPPVASLQPTPTPPAGTHAGVPYADLQFEYAIPSASKLQFAGNEAHTYVFYEGPAAAHTDGSATEYSLVPETDRRGVIVTSLENVWVHGCQNGGGRSWVQNTPNEFLIDLRGIAGFAFGDAVPTTLDGWPALAARLDLPRTVCPGHIHVGEPITGLVGSSGLPLESPSLLTVSMVNGLPVLVDVWARTEEDLDAWLPTATEFMDSIHFGPRTLPDASPAAPPPASPTPGPQDVLSFIRPFEYTTPASGSVELRSCRLVSCAFYDGIHDGNVNGGPGLQGPGDQRGVILASLDGSYTLDCPWLRRRPLIGDTPGTYLEYFIDDGDGDSDTNLPFTPSDLDGRPAVSVRLQPMKGTCQRGDLYLVDPGGASKALQLALPSMVTLVEVDGAVILVDVWARSEDDLDAWLPTAQELLDSIHFTATP